MAEDRSEKGTFPRFWLFVLLILGSVVLGDLNQRMADARSLEKDLEFLLARSGRLDAEIADLEERIEYVNSDDFIRDWAHDQAKMVDESEVLVIFVASNAYSDVVAPSQELDAPTANSLEVWLELIFGR